MQYSWDFMPELRQKGFLFLSTVATNTHSKTLVEQQLFYFGEK
jgi:hypothetical protein